MSKRFEQLSFIIGLFFVSLSLILAVGYLMTEALHKDINLYSGSLFFIFGVIMLLIKSGEE